MRLHALACGCARALSLSLIDRQTSGEISDSHPRQLHAKHLTDQDDGKDHHEQEERKRCIGPHNVWGHGALMKRGGGETSAPSCMCYVDVLHTRHIDITEQVTFEKSILVFRAHTRTHTHPPPPPLPHSLSHIPPPHIHTHTNIC